MISLTYENNFTVVYLQRNCFETEWPSNSGSHILAPDVHNIRAPYGFQDLLNLYFTLFKANAEHLQSFIHQSFIRQSFIHQSFIHQSFIHQSFIRQSFIHLCPFYVLSQFLSSSLCSSNMLRWSPCYPCL